VIDDNHEWEMIMMRQIGMAIAASALFAVAACNQSNPMSPTSASAPDTLFAKPDGNGNGAPSGGHYNLELIGVPRNKTASITNGNRIFIYYEGQVDILLSEGPYKVLDGNGTDDGEASFQLPNPDPENDGGTLAYSVWVRPVAGKGDISFASCFTEADGSGTWCYAGELVQNMRKRKTFVDVSKELLQVCADVDDGAGTSLQLVPLFDEQGRDYFWHVDNDGMRNVQMRFYDIGTKPIGGACERVPHPNH
jgi:hypothetical protein